MEYSRQFFKNGLTTLTVPMPQTEAVMMIAMVKVGSRNEKLAEQGLAHFIEHMAFKGGRIFKNAHQLSAAIDGVGGEINAFTTEEVTAYHIKIAREHLRLGLDVLSDLVIHPRFPAPELEREKGVIVEEINMYEDMPRYKAALEIGPLIYPNHPLGRSTAGTRQTITAFKRQNFLNFHRRFYTGTNITLILAGAVEVSDIEEVRKRFSSMPAGVPSKVTKPKEEQKKPAKVVVRRQSEQTHLVIGLRALKISDPRRHAYKVLTTALGGNMSSRLFFSIREKQGLGYYINANTQGFMDTGYLAISAGVDNRRFFQAVKSIIVELRDLKENKISPAELEKAKQYVIGKIKLGLEDSEEVAGFFASQQVLEGQIMTPQEMIEGVKRASVEDILLLSREIFQAKNLNLSVVGPVEDSPSISEILSEL